MFPDEAFSTGIKTAGNVPEQKVQEAVVLIPRFRKLTQPGSRGVGAKDVPKSPKVLLKVVVTNIEPSPSHLHPSKVFPHLGCQTTSKMMWYSVKDVV